MTTPVEKFKEQMRKFPPESGGVKPMDFEVLVALALIELISRVEALEVPTED